jgi:YcxB-like protein
MNISYRPALGDLVHAARVWEANHWKLGRRFVATTLVAVGVFQAYAGAYAWAVVFVLLGVLEFFNLLPAAALRAYMEWKMNPKFREEYHLEFAPEHLRFRTATVDSTLKWTHYSGYLETDRVFILIYGKRMYTVIPKRALQGPEQVEQLRTLINHSINGFRQA